MLEGAAAKYVSAETEDGRTQFKLDRRIPPSLVEPQPLVKLQIEGPRNEIFTVHKNFICHYSPYFENILRRTDHIYVTLRMNSWVVGVFVNWLYTKTLVEQGGKQLNCLQLVNLWIYAGLWSVPVLQNHVLKQLNQARAHEKSLPSNLLNTIWKSTEEESPLRRYVVDTWHNGPLSSLHKYPKELLFEIASTINTRPQNGKVILSPEEMEKYFVDETYSPLPSPESEGESTSHDDSEPAAAAEEPKDAQSVSAQAISSYLICLMFKKVEEGRRRCGFMHGPVGKSWMSLKSRIIQFR